MRPRSDKLVPQILRPHTQSLAPLTHQNKLIQPIPTIRQEALLERRALRPDVSVLWRTSGRIDRFQPLHNQIRTGLEENH